MDEYKGLNLNREQIISKIREFGEKNYTNFNITSKILADNNRINHIISTNGKPASITLIQNNDGTTTLMHKTGQNQEESLKIAEFLKTQCSIGEGKNSSLSIKNLSEENLTLCFEYLKEDFDNKIVHEKEELEDRISYKLSLATGEKISLTYFKTKTLLIQGKPLLLYNSLFLILTEMELIKRKEVIKETNEKYGILINENDIEKELKTYLPLTHMYLEENLKNIFISGLAINKLEINIPDYSSFLFSILKGLEGCIKLLLLKKTIKIDKSFNIFIPKHIPFIISPKFKAIINDQATCNAIENMYNYYNKERHSLFHTECIDCFTRIIDKKEDATKILNDTFVLIENSLSVLNK